MSSPRHPDVPDSSATPSSATPSGSGIGPLPRTNGIADEFDRSNPAMENPEA